MKIRNGFVSNSSSSSFICDVCGHSTSGWDMSTEEAGMYECINGHTFCEDHLVSEIVATKEEVIEQLDTLIKDYQKQLEEGRVYSWTQSSLDKYIKWREDILNSEDESTIEDYADKLGFFDRSEVLEKYCPVCSMDVVTDGEMLKYLLKTANTTSTEVQKQIQERFKTYSEFNSFMRNNG